ncbi:LuxR C-terminal-related transcriptional regulator [Devosia salina]|uniref:LuxR C-terminal-related transcriptional regulator n=1 Tax=Devosia salina TaxID=2860336 RepID=A0ABX8WH87_9HYPH|nr:LuxR C-terminal-related transcriptional regulator [Devosia salina]QYO77595.1 LuxR C-terminal-related transcriptional regulator [Devosia salina]
MSEEDDRAELIALMHAQRAAIWTQNFQAWADCFVPAPYTVRFGYWAGGGTFVRRGWDEISRRARAHMEGHELPYNTDYAFKTVIKNLNLRICGDMAWAIYDQQYPGYDYPGHVGPGLANEFRVFERHGGRWKIAAMCFFDNNAGRKGEALLILDGEGRVQWTSPEAARRLPEDDDLVIRNGRLRVRDTACDRKLQAAVRWAAGVDGGYNSGRGSVPIVLGQGEGLPTRVWWIKVEGGAIYFVLDGAPMAEERLDQAALIFGLSVAQRRLARLIADGRSLPDAAAQMGISANTAKTHLQRIYDKTGVHSQPALVRVLLSVGVPL